MAGHVQRLSRYDEHQKQKLGSKEAMTALINPSYDSNADSPTDAVNANTTVSVSDVVTDVLGNELKTMSMKLDSDSKDYTDSNLTVDNHDNNEVKRRNSGTSSGKSRTKYASTDLSEMGIGDPLESLSDSNSQPDSEEGRLTVADDNILRERNKKKAEAMFADIDFIDDGDEDDEDDSEDSSDEEEDEDNSKDCEQEKNIKRVKGDVHVVEYDEQDDDDDDDEDEDSEAEDVSGTGSPKDPDADVASPDDEVIAAKLGGFLSYYANLESLAKSRVAELEDDEASINGSVSDSDLSENHEGLYEPPQHPTPYDSGPSTMDEESTDCESTYEMLYKSFGLRTQEEVVSKELLSPMGGQPDHGYASETSTDDKTSPIKRPGLLVNESSKPSLSTLIEDSKASSPESHCSKLSPTTEAESGIEVTPEPKSNLEPILDSKKNAISKPTSLPPGWREVADTRGTYYWHVPSGTTQWSPPSPSSDDCSSPPKKPARTLDPQCSTSSSSDPSDSGRGSSSTEADNSLQAFQQSTLRYANLKLVPGQSQEDEEKAVQEQVSPRGIRFHVRSLGWVEMDDSDLSPGKSSLAVNNCIRQLSYRKNDIRDTAGIWGEGKDMYMVLEDEYLKLTDPNDGTVLNSQHVCSIRVWGVGRDNGRDFAYVARDKVTKRYKCHVFRCDIPAKAIANALHEICARVMSERQKGHTISMVTQGQMIQQQQQQQLMQMRSISLDSNKAPTPTTAVDFPTPKAEPITVFRAHYVGNAFVPKHGGMETLNMAINKAFETIPEENWIPVRIEVAVSTVTVTNIKTKEIIAENRIRFLSFLGIGPDIRQFGYIMCIGKNKFQSHVFCCEHSAGGLAKAIEAACKLRYQKCLDARPKGHSYRSDHSANGKGWGGAIKNSVSSLFSKLKGTKEAPIAAV